MYLPCVETKVLITAGLAHARERESEKGEMHRIRCFGKAPRREGSAKEVVRRGG